MKRIPFHTVPDAGVTRGFASHTAEAAALSQGRICGGCQHFDRAAAQQAMFEEKFVERIIREEKWRSLWFRDWGSYGVCHQFSDSEGLRIVDPTAPAVCSARDLDSSLHQNSPAGQQKRECPFWRPRKDGRFMTVSRSSVHGPSNEASPEAQAYIKEKEIEKRSLDRRGGK